MGIMARGTGLGANGISAMCFLEGFLLAVMARETKLRIGIVQKICLVGTVRNVTYSAATGLERFMDHLLFELLLCMALIAEVVAFHFEQMIGLARVGIVAERALPFFQRGVDMGLGHANILFA